MVLFVCALLVSGQALDSLSSAYRDKPTLANRNALLRFASAHAKDTSGALALFAVGVTDVEAGNYPEAIRRLDSVRQRIPQLGDYIAFNIGSAQFSQQNFAAAAKELETVWKWSPSSPLASRAALLAAQALVESGGARQAAEILKGQYTKLPQPRGDLALAAAYEASENFTAAAELYQRVYYGSPASDEASEAAIAIQRLRQSMDSSYPQPEPATELGRAEKLLAAGENRAARSAFHSLVSELGGAERELARVDIGVADYSRNQSLTAYRYLESLDLNSPEADAKKLYYLVACARRLDDHSKMMEFVDLLNRRHPKSEWRLKALIWAGNEYLLANDSESYEPLYRACYESFPEDPAADYCHWKVAWHAYLQRKPEAAALLEDHIKRFPQGTNISAALYFLGRLAEKSGDPTTAQAYYRKILEHYPNYFYTGLAEERLSRVKVVHPASVGSAGQALEGIDIPVRDMPASFRPSAATQRRLERARLLNSAGMPDLAERELRFAAKDDGQPHVLALELARVASRQGAPDRAIRHIKGVFPEYLSLPFESAPVEFWRLAFPLPYRKELEKYCRQNNIDPFLFAGLIRQESEFNPKAVSRAKARGLTQILPSTGRQLSRKLRLRYRLSYLTRPDFNLRLGAYYFRTLLDQHDGQLEATLASYNGGKTRVDDWITWASYEEQAEFIETIPFTETRTYVQAVLRNAAMYRRLYGADSGKVTSADGSSIQRGDRRAASGQ